MIPAAVRRTVRAIYGPRCGYCGRTEAEIGAELTFDHFRPHSYGGPNAVENIVYACHACNEFKGSYWSDEPEGRLLHPLNDDLTAHIREDDDGLLSPLTPLGTAYIRILQLNRAPLVASRAENNRRRQAEERLSRIESSLRQVLERITALEKQEAD